MKKFQRKVALTFLAGAVAATFGVTWPLDSSAAAGGGGGGAGGAGGGAGGGGAGGGGSGGGGKWRRRKWRRREWRWREWRWREWRWGCRCGWRWRGWRWRRRCWGRCGWRGRRWCWRRRGGCRWLEAGAGAGAGGAGAGGAGAGGAGAGGAGAGGAGAGGAGAGGAGAGAGAGGAGAGGAGAGGAGAGGAGAGGAGAAVLVQVRVVREQVAPVAVGGRCRRRGRWWSGCRWCRGQVQVVQEQVVREQVVQVQVVQEQVVRCGAGGAVRGRWCGRWWCRCKWCRGRRRRGGRRCCRRIGCRKRRFRWRGFSRCWLGCRWHRGGRCRCKRCVRPARAGQRVPAGPVEQVQVRAAQARPRADRQDPVDQVLVLAQAPALEVRAAPQPDQQDRGPVGPAQGPAAALRVRAQVAAWVLQRLPPGRPPEAIRPAVANPPLAQRALLAQASPASTISCDACSAMGSRRLRAAPQRRPRSLFRAHRPLPVLTTRGWTRVRPVWRRCRRSGKPLPLAARLPLQWRRPCLAR